jgi:hypothetical protein
MSVIRFPFDALAVATGTDTNGQIADLLGVTRRTIQRAKRDGLSLHQAYEWCDRLRLHPFELWPELTDAALEAEAERRRQRKREAQRRYRAKNPDYRARQAEYRRRYYAEHGAYERARQRRYDRKAS